MKKKIFSIIIVLLISIICIFAFSSCKDNQTSSGNDFDTKSKYQSDTIKFWAGVGKAYIIIENEEFDVMFSVGGGEYESWLHGTCFYDLNTKDLIFTSSWDESNENATKLNNVKSGESFRCTPIDGVYEIEVVVPQAGIKSFKIVV